MVAQAGGATTHVGGTDGVSALAWHGSARVAVDTEEGTRNRRYLSAFQIRKKEIQEN